MVAFLGTLFLGVEYGLAIAVAASLLNIIYESVYPHTAVLGRLPGTTMYKNIKQYPRAERYDGLLIVRIDGPLNFANAVNVRDKIRKYKRLAEEDLKKRRAGDVHYIVLDLSSMSNIDTTAMHVLQDMHLTQKHLSVQLCLANPGINVTERLMKSGLVDVIGRQHVFSSVIDAVQWCLNDMDRATEQTTSEEP
jgi:sulfate transporter 4